MDFRYVGERPLILTRRTFLTSFDSRTLAARGVVAEAKT